MLLRSSLFALLLLVTACKSPSHAADTSYVVVDANGDSPLTGRSLTVARAFFVQDLPGAVEDFVETEIANGTFDLVVPIASQSAPIEVRLELASLTGVELVGGTPSYYPAESLLVNVLVGEPGTCDVVENLVLDNARAQAGANLFGSYALVSGGVGSADSATVDIVDTLVYAQSKMTDAAGPLGPTRAATIDRLRALVVSTNRSPYVHRIVGDPNTDLRPTVVLHAGAEKADVVLEAPNVGAIVVGGGDDAAPSNQASFVTPPAALTGSVGVVNVTLAAAQPDRAAAYGSNGLWIVSGGASPTTLEQVGPLATSSVVRIADLADGTRRGGSLVANDAGTAMLLFGGVDAGGAPRTDTIAITGCPDACVAAPGPTWTTARTGAFVHASGVIVGGVEAGVPSDRIERIVFGNGTFSIEPLGPLVHPRDGAAVVRYPTGPVLIFGGRDASGPRKDIEICFATP